MKAADTAGSITQPGVQLAAGRVRVVRIEKSPTPGPEVVTLTVSISHDGSPPSRMMLPLGADNDMFGGADVVRVEVATLQEAITIAHPVRHGRQRPGELQQRHVDALLALDHHPRLHSLMDAQWDADYVRDKARDLWMRDNATDYLTLLGEDEIQRRVEAADHYGSDLDGRPSQDCPVCGNDTLVPTSIDAFGIGIAVGTCIVCGYWRSPRIVDIGQWTRAEPGFRRLTKAELDARMRHVDEECAAEAEEKERQRRARTPEFDKNRHEASGYKNL